MTCCFCSARFDDPEHLLTETFAMQVLHLLHLTRVLTPHPLQAIRRPLERQQKTPTSWKDPTVAGLLSLWRRLSVPKTMRPQPPSSVASAATRRGRHWPPRRGVHLTAPSGLPCIGATPGSTRHRTRSKRYRAPPFSYLYFSHLHV